MRWFRSTLVLAIAAGVCAAALAAPAAAQSKTIFWNRYDVVLTILPNGDLRVLERQQITFVQGTFTYGYAVVPTDKTEGISDVQISEPGGRTYEQQAAAGAPYTFSAEDTGGEVEIRWYFPPTSNTTRSYDLAYTVHGTLRVYDSGDKLQWIAIDNQRDFPVLQSSVTVNLPQGAKFEDIDSAGVRADWQQSADGRSVTYTATAQMDSSDTFEIGVEFTHGVIPNHVPGWQSNFDQAEFYDRSVRPALNLGIGVIAALLAIGGPLVAYLMWYTRGRDPNVGPVPEYVAEPPDSTPPGLLGTLIDEHADMQDVVATVVDLARKGYLEIKETEGAGLFGVFSRDHLFTRLKEPDTELTDYEREVMRGIFPSSKKERRLSDLRNKFYTHLPKIQSKLYDELVDRGYFKRSPETVRGIWRGIGIAVLVLAFLAAAGASSLAAYAGAVFCLPAALGMTGVALMIASRFMPVKSLKGAESTARWLAFKNYLARIDQYTDLNAATELFERYLPYAVAFGMNNSWVNKFSQISATPAPPWYQPYPTYRTSSGGGRLARTVGGASGGPGGSGGLQGMSGGLSSGLQSMSDGLSHMLNSTGHVLSSAPSSSGSSGGGFSGGGFSGGGGGGGGGRGFG